MAGTTGLEPATSAVTGQRSDQLSYVPRLFFNNLVIRHIESSVSQLSPFSLFSTISLLWTQFWASVDTTWTPRWTPNQGHPNDKIKSNRCGESLVSTTHRSTSRNPKELGAFVAAMISFAIFFWAVQRFLCASQCRVGLRFGGHVS